MAKEAAHRDVSRIDGVQLAFLQAGNFELSTPLNWTVYGDPFTIP
jgi:chitosanase